jgi:hypothetical protein
MSLLILLFLVMFLCSTRRHELWNNFVYALTARWRGVAVPAE